MDIEKEVDDRPTEPNIQNPDNQIQTYQSIKIVDIDSDPKFNCRGKLTPSDVEFLMKDIAQKGLLQPVVIQKIIGAEKPYRAVAGFSRLMACELLGWTEIPAKIISVKSEFEARILNLSENVVRKNLNILQEARALGDLKRIDPSLSQEDMAKKLQQSRGWDQVRMYVLDLPPECHEALDRGLVSQDQIRALWQIPSRERQLNLIKKIKEARERGERISLREPIVPNPDTKFVRNRSDIFKMQDHIQKFIGNNFGTRCLAWASGEIPDRELCEDIRQIAVAEGKLYEEPADPVSVSEE